MLFFFFFFQAEDGIRDYKVTGVQTCALPISRSVVFRTIAVPSTLGRDATSMPGRRVGGLGAAGSPLPIRRHGCRAIGRARRPVQTAARFRVISACGERVPPASERGPATGNGPESSHPAPR